MRFLTALTVDECANRLERLMLKRHTGMARDIQLTDFSQDGLVRKFEIVTGNKRIILATAIVILNGREEPGYTSVTSRAYFAGGAILLGLLLLVIAVALPGVLFRANITTMTLLILTLQLGLTILTVRGIFRGRRKLGAMIYDELEGGRIAKRKRGR